MGGPVREPASPGPLRVVKNSFGRRLTALTPISQPLTTRVWSVSRDPGYSVDLNDMALHCPGTRKIYKPPNTPVLRSGSQRIRCLPREMKRKVLRYLLDFA